VIPFLDMFLNWRHKSGGTSDRAFIVPLAIMIIHFRKWRLGGTPCKSYVALDLTLRRIPGVPKM
jgi:hypothetical protein